MRLIVSILTASVALVAAFSSDSSPPLLDFTHVSFAPLPVGHPATAAKDLLLHSVRARVGWDWGSGDGAPLILSFHHDVVADADSFAVSVTEGAASLSASTPAGFLSAVGRLAREARLHPSSGSVLLPRGEIGSTSSARWEMRGHQFAMENHPCLFRTCDQMTQHARELMIFGTNQIETAHSDPANVEGLKGFSAGIAEAGANVSLYWGPHLANVSLSEKGFAAMPRVDAIFFPGGDGPGACVDWEAAEELVKALRRHHPDATAWYSAQTLDAQDLAYFLKNISRPEVRAWLDGIVYGPHHIVPFTEFCRLIPDYYPIRQYPDICHTMGAQYPVYDWHHAWVWTHGRHAVNPMPRMFSNIILQRDNGSTPSIGVGAYSEGLNDDLHKCLWSAMGEDSTLSVEEAVRQYARYFFSPENEEAAYEGLTGLEENWKGAPEVERMRRTMERWEEVAGRSNASAFASNWRLMVYLQRSMYDVYVGMAFRAEVEQEERAYAVLRGAEREGSRKTIDGALEVLSSNATLPKEAHELRRRLENLTALVDVHWGLEVIMTQDSTLDMRSIDTPLSDRQFLVDSLHGIETLTNETARIEAIMELVNWGRVPNGSFYDFLGGIFSEDHPRLNDGEGPLEDPAVYFTPLQAENARFPQMRIKWNRFAQIYYDNHLVMRYRGLDTSAGYELRVAYEYPPETLGSTKPSPSRLVANGFVLRDYSLPPSPMQVSSFSLPRNLTSGGTLDVECYQPLGSGGMGHSCQISEVWLMKVS